MLGLNLFYPLLIVHIFQIRRISDVLAFLGAWKTDDPRDAIFEKIRSLADAHARTDGRTLAPGGPEERNRRFAQ